MQAGSQSFCHMRSWRKKQAVFWIGSLPALKVKPIPHFSTSVMDLTGPIWLQEYGRNKKKVWLGILVSKNTGLIYLDILEDYSAKSVDNFISTMEYELCVKLRMLKADSGSNFI